jgi:uncharacterized protein YdaU (DUF1376 family)
MKKSPAFQFYPNDWLSSPKIAMMTPAQEGAYIRLLCYCWASGDCSLPNNETQLLTLSRLNNIDDLRVVEKCFNQSPTDSTKLVHDRLILEAQKQHVWKQKSSAGGKKSAKQRADNKRDFKGGSNLVQPKANISSSSSSSSSNKYTYEFEIFWEKFPRQRRGDKDKTFTAWKNALNKTTTEEILNGLQAYIGSSEVANGYAKGAAAWLSDSRWTSQYTQAGELVKPKSKPTLVNAIVL